MQELKLKESIIREAQIKIIMANQKLFDSFFVAMKTTGLSKGLISAWEQQKLEI